MAGLYIHVPFCLRRCKYCDFYSVALEGGARAKPDTFLDALDRELAGLPNDFAPETVFMGGGTPTALSDVQLARLFQSLKNHVDLRRVTEWSCEANPGTLNREKARLLLESGVNRVSLGVQSFDPQNLAFLGRIHSSAEARDSYLLLRDTGFRNINLDLIYGIPGSSRAVLERDLDHIVNLAPEHVATYCLIFEEGTPITKLRDKGEIAEVDDDEELEHYRLVRETLQVAGYDHYEISNFAKPGFECLHNHLYWSGGEYIGVGPAAHSHQRGLRYANMADLSEYCRALLKGESVRVSEERLDPEAKARETLIMLLRRLKGLSRDAFKTQTGFDYRDLRGKEIDWLCELGLLEETGGNLRLTEKGLFVSDSVFAELV